MDQPKIEIPATAFDRMLEIAALTALICLWGLALGSYSHLPEVIPVHFNFYGKADSYGPRSFIWMLPGLATVLFGLMTAVNRHPHRFNYLARITPENAARHYARATRLMRYLKLAIMLIFGLIVVFVTFPAVGAPLHLPSWGLPLSLALVFGPVLVYVLRSFS
jgi:uncharacterized membrane protein